MRPLILLFLLASATGVYSADARYSPEIKTLTGAVIKGEVIGLTEAEIRLRVDGTEKPLPAADVLFVDLMESPRPLPTLPHILVRLVDGTMLRCNALALRGSEVEARLFDGLALKFPLNSLHYFLCEAHNEANRTEFEQLLAKHPTQDVLRLLSRDGTAVNTFEGFVGEADAKGERVKFKTDGDTVEVAMNRIRGVIFSRKAEDAGPAPVCKVIDLYQNVLTAVKVASNADSYEITTPSGLKVAVPTALVQRFDFSLGKMVYLSDLEPLRVEESPLLADLWHYRRDTNLQGGPIRLDRKTYTKGLALHSRTVLEYDVKGYNTFRCLLGIDEQISGPAHAVVRIEGDSKELFESPLTGKDKPRELELKITGVNRLRVTVDYGEDLDLGDHVLFAEARVTK